MNAGELAGREATVEAPATIANLGAGYDCLGMAVELLLRVTVAARTQEAGRPDVELEVEGEGADELAADRSNRFVVALEAALTAVDIGVARTAWTIRMSNPIPLERGLGSSAAATVAGIVAAGELAGRSLDQGAALEIATRIEGHPDNVAAGLLGGIVASISLPDRVEAVRLDPPGDVAVIAWIPELRLATSEMRRVLPDSVPRADAVANLARVAVGVAGLASGSTDVIRLLTEDRLHEPYRSEVYPALPELLDAARAAGAVGACLAGAGSTVIAFVDESDKSTSDAVTDALRRTASRLALPGRAARFLPTGSGARVTSS